METVTTQEFQKNGSSVGIAAVLKTKTEKESKMRRHEAKNLVYEHHYTAGELKDHLLENMELADGQTSRLNSQFTRSQIWEILYKGLDAHPNNFRMDSGHPSLVVAAANVIREFGAPPFEG